MTDNNFGWYKYIDDTDHAWLIKVSNRLAAAGGLQAVPRDNPERLQPMGRNYRLRHIKLVALTERPGMQKYRTDLIVNERDPSKFVGKRITVDGEEMKCTRYVGEQRRAY